MDSFGKVNEWIKTHAPVLANLYENKYVGMLYDRFASLPAKQQKQVLVGVVGGFFLIVFGIVLSSYLTLWSHSGKSRTAQSMINMLLQYQNERRTQDAQIQILERNSQLAAPDALKQHLIDQARFANISPRMVKAEEREEGGAPDTTKAPQEVKVKYANVKLEKINLAQLKGYLQAIEFGNYNLSVSSVTIQNDDQLRGYMNVELGVVAYLFPHEEEGGGT